MIASCWHWDSATYQYFFLPDEELDAGGWGIPRGLEAKPRGSASNVVETFEAALPALPRNALFCGAGTECVGSLYELKDSEQRAELDLNELRRSSDPSHQKVIRLLESPNEGLRSNAAREGVSSEGPRERPRKSETKLLWEYTVPVLTGLGAGVGVLRYAENLKLKSAFLIWLAGSAVGVAVGAEIAKSRCITES